MKGLTVKPAYFKCEMSNTFFSIWMDDDKYHYMNNIWKHKKHQFDKLQLASDAAITY